MICRKAVAEPARRRPGARRTSAARRNAARAHQGLLKTRAYFMRSRGRGCSSCRRGNAPSHGTPPARRLAGAADARLRETAMRVAQRRKLGAGPGRRDGPAPRAWRPARAARRTGRGRPRDRRRPAPRRPDTRRPAILRRAGGRGPNATPAKAVVVHPQIDGGPPRRAGDPAGQLCELPPTPGSPLRAAEHLAEKRQVRQRDRGRTSSTAASIAASHRVEVPAVR